VREKPEGESGGPALLVEKMVELEMVVLLKRVGRGGAKTTTVRGVLK